MGMFVGFLFGRFLFGTTAGRTALKGLVVFVAFVIAMSVGGTMLAKAHVDASMFYSGVLLVIALVLFARAKARFFTLGGIVPFALGVLALVAAWGFVQHAPHVVAHVHATHHAVSHAARVSLNGTVSLAVRAIVVLATVLFGYLGVVWIVRLVKRQIAMEYLFHNYVKWHSARMQHGA